MNNFTFGDAQMGYYETIAGGAGAGPGWHGRSGVHTHMTNTRITDPEILERRCGRAGARTRARASAARRPCVRVRVHEPGRGSRCGRQGGGGRGQGWGWGCLGGWQAKVVGLVAGGRLRASSADSPTNTLQAASSSNSALFRLFVTCPPRH